MFPGTDKLPVTFNVTACADETGPLTVNAVASTNCNPPAVIVMLPKLVIAFAGPVSTAEPPMPDALNNNGVVIVPELSLIPPPTVLSETLVVPASVPVTVTPPLPLFARLIAAADTVPETFGFTVSTRLKLLPGALNAPTPEIVLLALTSETAGPPLTVPVKSGVEITAPAVSVIGAAVLFNATPVLPSIVPDSVTLAAEDPVSVSVICAALNVPVCEIDPVDVAVSA